ncbi:MAG: hypothetical protein M1824_001919 [Vezdaea acicularis]|nr:MAG: hypothetical protein M1824_001919 [Vezdaea acicularis]
MFSAEQLTQRLPQFKTRRALLIVDFQEEFLPPSGNLSVPNLPEIVTRVKQVVPDFRDCGDIVWVRSEFQQERPVNDGQSESVITDVEVQKSATAVNDGSSAGGSAVSTPPLYPGMSRSTSEHMKNLLAKVKERNPQAFESGDEDEDGTDESTAPPSQYNEEMFLSRDKDRKSKSCCLPDTHGAKFIETIKGTIDEQRDMLLTKSYYSAFKENSLLPTFRGNIVTEIYVCGALSNISVFATVLDAARHGFATTIIDDCLGYRNESRHKEAMKQMTEYIGADAINTSEFKSLIRGWRKSEIKSGHTVGRASDKAQIENILSRLSLKDSVAAESAESKPKLKQNKIVQRGRQRKRPGENGEKAITKSQLLAQRSKSRNGEGNTKATKGHDLPPTKNGVSVPVEVEKDIDISTKTPDEELMKKTLEGIPREPIKTNKETLAHAEELPRIDTNDLPSPTFQNLEAVSARLEEVASNPRSFFSRPTATVPIETPTNVETARAQTIRSIHKNRVSRTHIRGQSVPTLGPEDIIAEGDSRIVYNLLPQPLRDVAFEKLKAEVQWQTMHHRGGEVPRLVAVEGLIDEDGSFPIYRHPADESPPLLPFSETVSQIRDEVQKVLQHPVNHVLIQHYRHGQDYISEHSDKTLDIVRGSSIVNVSIGAQRSMTLRTKKSSQGHHSNSSIGTNSAIASNGIGGGSDISDALSDSKLKDQLSPDDAKARSMQRIPMPHNSMFILGQVSNAHWLHGIRPDKRPLSLKSEDELAFGGSRISLTFRHIGTFLDASSTKIWGQGARAKDKTHAAPVVNGDTYEAEQMIKAFGAENQRADFDWDAAYGEGFDVLHITSATPKLFASGDAVVDARVKICLAEKGLLWDVKAPSPSYDWKKSGTNLDTTPALPEPPPRIKFVDHDADRSEVEGDLAILLYLETYCLSSPLLPPMEQRADIAAVYTRVYASDSLLALWRAAYHALASLAPSEAARFLLTKQVAMERQAVVAPFRRELRVWERWVAGSGGDAEEKGFVAGERFTLADCAFWPVLDEIVAGFEEWRESEWPALSEYWRRVGKRESVRLARGEEQVVNGRLEGK